MVLEWTPERLPYSRIDFSLLQRQSTSQRVSDISSMSLLGHGVSGFSGMGMVERWNRFFFSLILFACLRRKYQIKIGLGRLPS